MNNALLGLRVFFLHKSPIHDSSFKVRSQHIPNMPRSSLATDTSTELLAIIRRKEKSINFLVMSECIKTKLSILKKYKVWIMSTNLASSHNLRFSQQCCWTFKSNFRRIFYKINQHKHFSNFEKKYQSTKL
jgi:hypothetical protein